MKKVLLSVIIGFAASYLTQAQPVQPKNSELGNPGQINNRLPTKHPAIHQENALILIRDSTHTWSWDNNTANVWNRTRRIVQYNYDVVNNLVSYLEQVWNGTT